MLALRIGYGNGAVTENAVVPCVAPVSGAYPTVFNLSPVDLIVLAPAAVVAPAGLAE